jgi:hypothetical protein
MVARRQPPESFLVTAQIAYLLLVGGAFALFAASLLIISNWSRRPPRR